MISDTTKDAELFLRRSFYKSRVEDYQGAVEDLDKVIQLTPFDYKAIASRGDYKRYILDNDGALEDYATTLKLKDDFLPAYYARAMLLIGMDEFEKAKADLNYIIQQTPEDHITYYRRAMCNGYLGNLKESLEDFNASLKLKEEYKDAIHGKALLQYKIGDFNGALKNLDVLKKRLLILEWAFFGVKKKLKITYSQLTIYLESVLL